MTSGAINSGVASTDAGGGSVDTTFSINSGSTDYNVNIVTDSGSSEVGIETPDTSGDLQSVVSAGYASGSIDRIQTVNNNIVAIGFIVIVLLSAILATILFTMLKDLFK